MLKRILSGQSADDRTREVDSTDIMDSVADSVLFNHDRIYQHNILHVNYTSYDVRRSQDVINPITSHRNIMMLPDSSVDDSCLDSPFCYAHVLGITMPMWYILALEWSAISRIVWSVYGFDGTTKLTLRKPGGNPGDLTMPNFPQCLLLGPLAMLTQMMF